MFPIKPVAGETNQKNVPGAADPLDNIWSKVNRRLNPTAKEIAETRYLGLFQFIDLTKDFFFSYTYDLTNSLQHNMTAATSKTFPPPPFKDMYAWNFFQTRELESLVGHLNSSYWVLPVIHGSCLQRKCSIFGRMINLTVIARRSRHFAGTRYLKRGVSDQGHVANDVEVEQIVHAAGSNEGVFSSFVQMRGSIPTFWAQESSVTVPKPPIVLSRVDISYQATQAHFADLLERYGSPLLVLDLVKHAEKREREVIVGREYRHAIEYINSTMPQEHRIRYTALDFSRLSKQHHSNVLKALEDVSKWAVGQTGIFCSAPQCTLQLSAPRADQSQAPASGVPYSSSQQDSAAAPTSIGGSPGLSAAPPHGPALPGASLPMEQKGVLRTNCIDCLDRTNVAQFSVGVYALGCQLYTMGITKSRVLDAGSSLVLVLMELYTELGDHIALQYGGSEAHKKVPGPGGQRQQELLTSIRRYYSNAFTDRVKQDAMNLFLGYFDPSEQDVPLWELDSDYYCHNFRVQSSGLQSMREFKTAQYYPELDLGDEMVNDELASASLDDNASGSVAGGSITTGGAGKQELGIEMGEPRRHGGSFSIYREQQMAADIKSKRTKVKAIRKAHEQVSSRWWRDALQKYAQQRMWMHLGPPKQGQLPSRFTRIYEPHRLTFFEDVFSNDFLTPVPVVADSRESSLLVNFPVKGHELANNLRVTAALAESALGNPLRRTASDVRPASPARRLQLLSYSESRQPGDRNLTIGGYVKGILTNRARNIMGLSGGGLPQDDSEEACEDDGPEHHLGAEEDLGVLAGLGMEESLWVKEDGMDELNDTGAGAGVDAEYINYLAAASIASPDLPLEDQLPHGSDQERINRAEFEEYLHEFSLDASSDENIVQECERLAEEGHCIRQLKYGPHRGLPQEVAANAVTAAVFHRLAEMEADLGLNKEEQMGEACKALQELALNEEGVREQLREKLAQDEEQKQVFTSLLREAESTAEAHSPDLDVVKFYCHFFAPSVIAQSMHELKPYINYIPTAPTYNAPTPSRQGDDKAHSMMEVSQVADDLYRVYSKHVLLNGPGFAAAKELGLARERVERMYKAEKDVREFPDLQRPPPVVPNW
ncbi:unnamed protein product [Chrysoparadoxa australica]